MLPAKRPGTGERTSEYSSDSKLHAAARCWPLTRLAATAFTGLPVKEESRGLMAPTSCSTCAINKFGMMLTADAARAARSAQAAGNPVVNQQKKSHRSRPEVRSRCATTPPYVPYMPCGYS